MHIIEYLRNNYLLYININNNIIYVMHILIRFKILNLLQCNIQQEYIIYILLHICVKIVRIAILYNNFFFISTHTHIYYLFNILHYLNYTFDCYICNYTLHNINANV